MHLECLKEIATTLEYMYTLHSHFSPVCRHLAPASSPCVQEPTFPQPRWGQLTRELSPPLQSILLSQIGPTPCPYLAFLVSWMALTSPSSLQTTNASFKSHDLSHTVPHWLLWYISTRPVPFSFGRLSARFKRIFFALKAKHRVKSRCYEQGCSKRWNRFY